MISTRSHIPLYLVIITIVFVLAIVGCGGGGSGGGGGGDNNSGDSISGGWASILGPSDTGQASTYCNTAYLSGEAFISNSYYRCCSGIAEDDTGVTVTWENQVTGMTGDATQRVSICPLLGTPFLCYHNWSATVPLVIGDNIIKVKAVDPGGSGGTDTITIFKPENSYSLTGLLSTYQDIGLGHFQTGIELELTGTVNKTAITSSAGPIGQYQFTCIPDGSYTLVPVSSSFNYIFDPEFRTFSVSGDDINGLDYKVDAYSIGGTITFESGAPVGSDVRVEVSDGNSSWSWYVQPGGIYAYTVPDGIYTITPSSSCLNCTFSPASRTVEVTGNSLTDLDFVYINL